MIDLIQTYSKEIAAVFAVILAFVLNQGLKPRAKIVYGIRSDFIMLAQEPLLDSEGKQKSPTQTVHTASFVVRNSGREPAENVEVTFNYPPQFLNVWPARHFETKTSDFSRHSLVFPSLAPSEWVQIEILTINIQVPELTSVRSDQSVGKKVTLQSQQVYPAWLTFLSVVMATIGIGATAYMVVWLIQFITGSSLR